MKIGFDLQTLETPEARRGIGRCTRGLVEQFVRCCPRHEVVGFGFSEPGPAELDCAGRANFEYRPFDLPHPREAWLNDGILAPFGWAGNMRDLDLYVVTSPLMHDILLPDGGPFPVVAMVYDLIPLLYRQSHPDLMPEYLWMLYDARLEWVKRCDALLSDSEATANDLLRFLGTNPETIGTIGVGIGDEFFERLPDVRIRRARQEHGITDSYILSVTGHNFRKNWEAAFQAFAGLEESVREHHQLVIVCLLDAPSRAEFQALARNLGIESRVILTGGVDDETLLAIYQDASALIFPSFAEGFGIPLTEAMASGVPVVASDIPVFREVAGDAARLVDPTQVDHLAGELGRVLTDKSLRRGLIEAGRRNVERYRWPRVIERTEAFLGEAAKTRSAVPQAKSRPPGDKRLRVAYFTPLPPQVSGIADYNECLVPELKRYVDLELFLDDGEPALPAIREEVPWHPTRDFGARHRRRPYDLCVYQIGNNEMHGLHYRYATAFPGVVLLHDYSLRFVFPLLNRRFSLRELRDDVERYCGIACPHSMAPHEVMGRLDLIDHPLNERLIDSSLGVIVHSHWNRDHIRRRHPDAPVEVVPHGVEFERRGCSQNRDEIRRRYRIRGDAFVVTCAGYLTATKRLTTILQAFADLVEKAPQALLCLVGRAADPQYAWRLHRMVEDLNLGGHVQFLGFVELDELYDILKMTDVCLNLRYPTLGETSGTLLRMMQCGKPVLVSAVGQFLEFPDSVCWKVDVNGAEQRQLLRYLHTLARDSGVRNRLGENAARFAGQYRWDLVAPLHVEAWERALRHAQYMAFAKTD